jgi:hypothetical protein
MYKSYSEENEIQTTSIRIQGENYKCYYKLEDLKNDTNSTSN